MTVMTKREKAARALYEEAKSYPVEEAVAILKKLPGVKFDESVDMSLHLGVDPKHADQMVRGAIVLPHGIGKTVRVAVFAKGEKVHVPVGKKSFPLEQLVQNAMTLLEAIVRAKPSASKGQYLRSITLSSTMGPGVHVDVQRVANLFKK